MLLARILQLKCKNFLQTRISLIAVISLRKTNFFFFWLKWWELVGFHLEITWKLWRNWSLKRCWIKRGEKKKKIVDVPWAFCTRIKFSCYFHLFCLYALPRLTQVLVDVVSVINVLCAWILFSTFCMCFVAINIYSSKQPEQDEDYLGRD